MTYKAGISPGVAQLFNAGPCEPHIVCDGCLTVRYVQSNPNKPPPSWFLDGKAAPGWRMVRDGSVVSGVRRDYCPRCKVSP